MSDPRTPSSDQEALEVRPSAEARRIAERQRVTRETNVSVRLDLDTPPASPDLVTISSSVPFLDHLLTALAWHGRISLHIVATGDTHIDDHHTVEDVGILLGKTLLEALGERRGIARFGHAYAPMDEALSRAVVDISGRSFLVYETRPVALPERVGGFDTQLIEEFWRAFAMEARLTLHMDLVRARNAHHAFESLFKAAGLALRMATRVDSSRASVPSTKGTLE